MPLFAYKARTRDGVSVVGEMQALDAKGVLSQLWGMNYVVVSVEPKGEAKVRRAGQPAKQGEGGFSLRRSKKVTAKDLSFFCRQLSTMIDAGVPLLAALNILQQQKGLPKLQEAIGIVRDELKNGASFSEAAAKSPKVFPPLFVNMIKAGELGGSLDEILNRLSDYFDKEHEVIEKVKSAMTYPAFMLLAAMAAITFMLGFVLPKFVGMLQGMNVELPTITKVVIGISNFFRYYWYIGAIIIGTGVILYKFMMREEKNRLWRDGRILRMPIFGNLLKKREIARFTKTLAILLRGGVPLLQSLEVVKRVTGNLLLQNTISNAQVSIKEGRGTAETLAHDEVFPMMVVQMIQIGEETGHMEEMLEKVAAFYEREVDVVVDRLSSILEPVFIVLLGGSMGVIMVSVMLPMFKMITSFQG